MREAGVLLHRQGINVRPQQNNSFIPRELNLCSAFALEVDQ